MKHAEELDLRNSLPLSDTIVERRPNAAAIDSSPLSIFVHTNKQRYQNEILAEEEQEQIEDIVMHVFLECLYGRVGYVPRYDRPRQEYSNTPRSAPYVSATKERADLITAAAEEIGIHPEDVVYLVGNGSGYTTLNESHHYFPVRTAAIHLERRVKRYLFFQGENNHESLEIPNQLRHIR